MKVGLLATAQALPNVALMRLSAYHKALGDQVVYRATPLDGCDKVYVSTLFTWQRPKVIEIASQFCSADVEIGGSGWDLALRLPAEVDTMPNDYSLFGIEYGIGYTSRGCIRDCDFCPVPGMEGWIREDKAIPDLLNPRSNRLILMDNNFFASDWRPKLAEIEQRGLVVDWPQGNDIRLMTPEIASALGRLRAQHRLCTVRGRESTLHFAWDQPATPARTDQVLRGIRALFAAGFTSHDLIFMVLVGFPGYTIEDELHRIDTLHSLGIQPYVMVYRDYGQKDTRDPMRMDIQHWNAGHVWRKVPFKEYRRVLAS